MPRDRRQRANSAQQANQTPNGPSRDSRRGKVASGPPTIARSGMRTGSNRQTIRARQMARRATRMSGLAASSSSIVSSTTPQASPRSVPTALSFATIFPNFASQLGVRSEMKTKTVVMGAALTPTKWHLRTEESELCERLRQLILDSFHSFASSASSELAAPKQMDFANFYQLSHRLCVELKLCSSLYDVVRSCTAQCFHSFADVLLHQLPGPQTLGQQASPSFASPANPSLHMKPAQQIVQFHRRFFGATLRYWAAAMAPAERRQAADSGKPMLLHELCCHQFAQTILGRAAIRNYLSQLTVLYFTRSRQRLNQELLLAERQKLDDCGTPQLEQRLIEDYLSQRYGDTSHSFQVIRDLIQVLLELDQTNQSIFGQLVELPLVERTILLAQQLGREQLRAVRDSVRSVADYLRWVARFVRADRQLLLTRFAFPAACVQAQTELLAFWLASRQMHVVVEEPNSGFAALVARASVRQMRGLYEQLQVLHRTVRHCPLLLAPIETFVAQHFAQLHSTLSAKYHFKRRAEMCDYVRDLLRLKNRWDQILLAVFRGAPNRCKVHEIVFRGFYQSLLIHERSAQALAFYMHQLLLQNSALLANAIDVNGGPSYPGDDDEDATDSTDPSLPEPGDQASWAKWANRRFRFTAQIGAQLSAELMLPLETVQHVAGPYALLGLVQYMKDVNPFYDYSKHYFCSRLLTATGRLPAQLELALFDLLAAEIKRVFLDDAMLSHGRLTVRKPFAQSLNDFKHIYHNFQLSQDFFHHTMESFSVYNGGRVKRIASFRILHAGMWKSVDYERCRIGEPLNASFRCVELLHMKRCMNRRLLLNTRHCTVQLEARLWRQQAIPLNLKVSQHQFAVLQQLDALLDDKANKPTEDDDAFTYEQVVRRCGFLRDYNAKLAILSLVHAGLLSACLVPIAATPTSATPTSATTTAAYQASSSSSCTSSQLMFRLNARHFYEDNRMYAGSSAPTRDLSCLEEVNFWAEEGDIDAKVVDQKTRTLVRALGIGDEDILLAASSRAVEDVNSSILLRSELASGNGGAAQTSESCGETGGAGGGAGGIASSHLAPNELSSTSSLELASIHSGRSSSSSLQTRLSSCGAGGTGGTGPCGRNVHHPHHVIERVHKVEAAIVRVLKRARCLDSLPQIHKLTSDELHQGRAPFPPTDLVSQDEVSKALLKLVDKKLIMRSSSGGFEFVID